jgi:PAS domain S-box-containing protein
VHDVSAHDDLRAAERLRLALDAGRLGDWSWDASSDLVSLSDRAADIFGLPRGQTITSTGLRELLHEQHREPAREAIERALATRADYDIEYQVRRSAGGECWVAARGRGAYGPDGAVLGMIGVVSDVTERKATEDALRDETRVLELLNRTGEELASQLDLRSLLQLITDAATELSGARFGAFFYNTQDEHGDRYQLFTLSGAPREAFERFGHPRATPLFGPTFRGEGVIRCDDVSSDPRYGQWAPHHGLPPGHLPVCSYLAVPVLTRSGAVLGGLLFGHPEPGVFTARSERIVGTIATQAAVALDNARLYEAAQAAAEERRHLLESERAARSHAERMSAMKDDFLAVLSHELRTPLSAILGWSQVLRHRPGIGGELAKGLEVIERNARVQKQLIEDLLDMSRIASGKLRLDVQPLAPHAVIEAAIESVRPSAAAKGIELSVALDRAAGPVAGDAARLQQVVWNLL